MHLMAATGEDAAIHMRPCFGFEKDTLEVTSGTGKVTFHSPPENPIGKTEPTQTPAESNVPRWAIDAAKAVSRSNGYDPELPHNRVPILTDADIIARHAPHLDGSAREALEKVVALYEERGRGHTVIYSERLAALMPEIRAALTPAAPVAGEDEITRLTNVANVMGECAATWKEKNAELRRKLDAAEGECERLRGLLSGSVKP